MSAFELLEKSFITKPSANEGHLGHVPAFSVWLVQLVVQQRHSWVCMFVCIIVTILRSGGHWPPTGYGSLSPSYMDPMGVPFALPPLPVWPLDLLRWLTLNGRIGWISESRLCVLRTILIILCWSPTDTYPLSNVFSSWEDTWWLVIICSSTHSRIV